MSYWKRFSGIALSLMLLFGVAACAVEQEEEGNMPEYDVEAGDVDIETEEKTVTVPEGVDIETPAEEAAEPEGSDDGEIEDSVEGDGEY